MKKLMIAAAIVCAAALSQAASIDWSIGNGAWKLADGTSMAAKNTVVYLINGDTSLDTIAKAVADGNVSAQEWYYGSAKTGNTKGAISAPGTSSDNLVVGTKYNFSALMVDGDKYMVSDVKSQFAYDPAEEAMGITFGSDQFNANAQTAGLEGAKNGWAAAAVPEPTSAMLLLLGMAGLALRRRRA